MNMSCHRVRGWVLRPCTGIPWVCALVVLLLCLGCNAPTVDTERSHEGEALGELIERQGALEQRIAEAGGRASFRCTRDFFGERGDGVPAYLGLYSDLYGFPETEYLDIEIAWSGDGSYEISAAGAPGSTVKQTMKFNEDSEEVTIDGEKLDSDDAPLEDGSPTEQAAMWAHLYYTTHFFPLTSDGDPGSVMAMLEANGADGFEVLEASDVSVPAAASSVILKPASVGEDRYGFSKGAGDSMVLDFHISFSSLGKTLAVFAESQQEKGMAIPVRSEFFALASDGEAKWQPLWTIELTDLEIE